MGTYDHKHILLEYANGRMTVEMAMGHTLQHIDHLYELQTTANVNRYELRGRVDTLENKIKALQAKVDRLTALLERPPPKRSKKAAGKQTKNGP